MGLRNVRTYIQSGNIVFRTKSADIGPKLEKEIERVFGVKTFVVVRTAAELRALTERNPLPGVDPRKLLVSFLRSTPTAEAKWNTASTPRTAARTAAASQMSPVTSSTSGSR
jgi:uncharacterized protein (DUF1697 family)